MRNIVTLYIKTCFATNLKVLIESESDHQRLTCRYFFTEPAPEAMASPLSGLNSVGTEMSLGLGGSSTNYHNTHHHKLPNDKVHNKSKDKVNTNESLGGSWSQAWLGSRQPNLPPQFLDAQDQVTTTTGSNAFLPCSVQHRGDRTVRE